MKNIVILISGGGSNMTAIVNTAKRDNWAGRFGARVAAVISNKAEAQGLQFAREHGIATEVLDHKAFDSREAFDAALAALMIGLARSFAVYLMPELEVLVPYLIMVGVLLIRPEGLFATVAARRI